MKFDSFIQADKGIAILLTFDEFQSIKSLLKEFYTKKHIEDIEDFFRFRASSTKFLLCNPYEIKQIYTPMMFENAVTFIDRVPFKKIEF